MCPCCRRQWHSGEGFTLLCRQAGSFFFLFSWFSQCLVLNHQEPGILLQHVVHFSTARIYPDPNTNSTPAGRHLSTVLCSQAAVLEKQQANWHFPAAQPNMVKNWHEAGIAATRLSISLGKKKTCIFDVKNEIFF